MNIVVGLLIGILCGVIPLVIALLTKSYFLAVLGMSVTAASGGLFAFLEESPFTAIGVAVVFVVILFAKNKRRNSHHDHGDHDEYMDDE